ncbi:MAG: polysaccharide biosynthesis C-terminal domain-containing protein [Flavobacteriales bacterium]
MASAKVKWFGRGLSAVLNTGRLLISPAINFLLAYWVIKVAGQAAWGQFVDVLIFTSLSGMFLSFGIKEYVLRQASLNPNLLGGFVKSGILTRLLLMVPVAAAAFIFFPINQAGWLMLWLSSLLIGSGLDPITNFNRSYAKAIVAELTFALFLFGFLGTQTINQNTLIVAFSIAAFIRSLVLSVLFRNELNKGQTSFDLRLLAAGLPFLLMGFSGMLQAKTDLYLVSIMLDDDALAAYQVSINFFVYLQALVGFILLPFAKNLYRAPKALIRKICFRSGVSGVLLLTVFLPIGYYILNSIYAFNLGVEVIILGGLYALPTFIFSPLVYKLLGTKQEKAVFRVTVFGLLVNVIFTYGLITQFGITGAFAGSMLSNWALLVGYLVVFRKTESAATNS